MAVQLDTTSIHKTHTSSSRTQLSEPNKKPTDALYGQPL